MGVFRARRRDISLIMAMSIIALLISALLD
jgi:hypothetical protein